jgi:hypothetical protein
VVKKALRSLPKYYSPKLSSIDESIDLDKISMDQTFSALIAFEMREFDKEVPNKEASFKASKKEIYK